MPPGTYIEFIDDNSLEYRLPEGWAMVNPGDVSSPLHTGNSGSAECDCQDNVVPPEPSMDNCDVSFDTSTGKASCTADWCQRCKLTVTKSRLGGSDSTFQNFPIHLTENIHFTIGSVKQQSLISPPNSFYDLPEVKSAINELNEQVYGDKNPIKPIDDKGNILPAYTVVPVSLLGYELAYIVPLSYDMARSGDSYDVSCDCTGNHPGCDSGTCTKNVDGTVVTCRSDRCCSKCKITWTKK